MSSFKVKVNGFLLKKSDKEIVIPLADTQKQPQIKFNVYPNKNYTILMVDPDAPSHSNPIYKYWLHLLIINNNQEIIKYMPPDPPKGSGPHRYIFYLLEQQNTLDKNKLKIYNDDTNTSRKNFNLGDFIINNNLTVVDSVYFKTESP